LRPELYQASVKQFARTNRTEREEYK
jgi:hypothetical protein